jgi:hypothetical protein
MVTNWCGPGRTAQGNLLVGPRIGISAPFRVARVRLTDVEGRTFEDRVHEGVVLFMSEQPVAMPMRVDLYDADGRLVGSHEWASGTSEAGA